MSLTRDKQPRQRKCNLTSSHSCSLAESKSTGRLPELVVGKTVIARPDGEHPRGIHTPWRAIIHKAPPKGPEILCNNVTHCRLDTLAAPYSRLLNFITHRGELQRIDGLLLAELFATEPDILVSLQTSAELGELQVIIG